MPVEDFDLTRLPLGEQPAILTTLGPQVLLCTEGPVVLTSGDTELRLEKGESAFVPAGVPVGVTGPGVLYRTTTNIS